MPIASAAQGITAIRLGTTAVNRVYSGSTLLYDATATGTITPATVRSVSAASVAYNTNSKTIARPAGTVAGDLLLLIMHCDYGSAAAFKVPAGFTTLNTRELSSNGDKQVIGYKIATGTEPTTYTVSVPVDADLRADMLCIQGSDPTESPAVTTAVSPSSATRHTAPSVTPRSSRGLLIAAVSFSSGTTDRTFSWTAPSGMTERTDASTNGYVTQTTATQTWDSSAATPTKAFTLSTTSGARQALTASIVVPSGRSNP